MSLHLVPNEIVGYRIKPDWHSYNVVLVKKHGPASKQAGAEYETPLAYCKHLASAADWIFSHALRTRGERTQAEIEAIERSCADIRGLQAVVDLAKQDVYKAVSELQARINALGLTQKALVKALGEPEESDEATAS